MSRDGSVSVSAPVSIYPPSTVKEKTAPGLHREQIGRPPRALHRACPCGFAVGARPRPDRWSRREDRPEDRVQGSREDVWPRKSVPSPDLAWGAIRKPLRCGVVMVHSMRFQTIFWSRDHPCGRSLETSYGFPTMERSPSWSVVNTRRPSALTRICSTALS
jgi:hypothetical protein